MYPAQKRKQPPPQKHNNGSSSLKRCIYHTPVIALSCWAPGDEECIRVPTRPKAAVPLKCCPRATSTQVHRTVDRAPLFTRWHISRSPGLHLTATVSVLQFQRKTLRYYGSRATWTSFCGRRISGKKRVWCSLTSFHAVGLGIHLFSTTELVRT